MISRCRDQLQIFFHNRYCQFEVQKSMLLLFHSFQCTAKLRNTGLLLSHNLHCYFEVYNQISAAISIIWSLGRVSCCCYRFSLSFWGAELVFLPSHRLYCHFRVHSKFCCYVIVVIVILRSRSQLLLLPRSLYRHFEVQAFLRAKVAPHSQMCDCCTFLNAKVTNFAVVARLRGHLFQIWFYYSTAIIN